MDPVQQIASDPTWIDSLTGLVDSISYLVNIILIALYGGTKLRRHVADGKVVEHEDLLSQMVDAKIRERLKGLEPVSAALEASPEPHKPAEVKVEDLASLDLSKVAVEDVLLPEDDEATAAAIKVAVEKVNKSTQNKKTANAAMRVVGVVGKIVKVLT